MTKKKALIWLYSPHRRSNTHHLMAKVKVDKNPLTTTHGAVQTTNSVLALGWILLNTLESIPNIEEHEVKVWTDNPHLEKSIKHSTFHSKTLLNCRKLLDSAGSFNLSTRQMKYTSPYVGSPKVCLLTKPDIKQATRKLILTLWKDRWKNEPTCRQTKLMIKEPRARLVKGLLLRDRKTLGMYIAYVTGHCTLRRHSKIMGINMGSTLCRLCNSEEETPHHVLQKCPRTEDIRDRFQADMKGLRPTDLKATDMVIKFISTTQTRLQDFN